MAFLLDTNVLIHLRDGDAKITAQVIALNPPILMSIISRVELEGGVYRDLSQRLARRQRLDTLIATIPVLTFDEAAADTYGSILDAAGYSRRKILDRMIAAQALIHRATLVTQNPTDYQDVPGLDLLTW